MSLNDESHLGVARNKYEPRYILSNKAMPDSRLTTSFLELKSSLYEVTLTSGTGFTNSSITFTATVPVLFIEKSFKVISSPELRVNN